MLETSSCLAGDAQVIPDINAVYSYMRPSDRYDFVMAGRVGSHTPGIRTCMRTKGACTSKPTADTIHPVISQ